MGVEQELAYWKKRGVEAEQLVFRLNQQVSYVRNQLTPPRTTWRLDPVRKCAYCHESAPTVGLIQHEPGCVVPKLEAIHDELRKFWNGESHD